MAHRPRPGKSRIHPLALLTGTLVSLTGCGQIGLGGGTGVNESTPDGTVLASGTFETLSSANSVTGLVQVISSASTGTNILHLESFSGPSETGLEIRAVVNGNDTRISTLRSSSGNMNYSTAFSGVASSWSSVSIRSTANDEVYGTAILQ